MSLSVIQVLDETTANQIAAGEVVERPASVIKELVENALDAASQHITIDITEGGLHFIRVSDDGVGMSPQDAKLAVLRHATSKIRNAEDLHQIGSLGFRGEALPSIASVSKFSLTTRLHDSAMATYLEIHGGSIIDFREAGAGVGTTIVVQDLFYNTPARRKFLKTTATESGYIHSILGKLALSHPHVAFKLINNGRQVLDTPGGGNILETLACLYGHNLFTEVVPVNYQDHGLRIEGYVGKPTLLKSSRQWQTYMINHRIVNSRIIAKALDSAYHSLLPKSGYPLAVLNIHIPLENVDVNVHPQKSEVKFSDEQTIYRAVYKAISEAIQKPDSLTAVAAPLASPRPSYFTPPAWKADPPQISPTLWKEDALPFRAVREELDKIDMPPAAVALSYAKEATPSLAGPAINESTPEDLFRPLGQVNDCYIIASGIDGLYIIDQHAAHERILYERLSAAVERVPGQPLLIPLFWEFDPLEMTLIEQHITLFAELGISLDIMGPSIVRVTELPADLSISDAEPTIRECLSLVQESKKPSAHTIRHSFLQVAACRSAIKAGDTLNMRQIQALLDELCATQFPYTCPHGRPSIIKFTIPELEKMFKRT